MNVDLPEENLTTQTTNAQVGPFAHGGSDEGWETVKRIAENSRKKRGNTGKKQQLSESTATKRQKQSDDLADSIAIHVAPTGVEAGGYYEQTLKSRPVEKEQQQDRDAKLQEFDNIRSKCCSMLPDVESMFTHPEVFGFKEFSSKLPDMQYDYMLYAILLVQCHSIEQEESSHSEAQSIWDLANECKNPLDAASLQDSQKNLAEALYRLLETAGKEEPWNRKLAMYVDETYKISEFKTLRDQITRSVLSIKDNCAWIVSTLKELGGLIDKRPHRWKDGLDNEFLHGDTHAKLRSALDNLKLANITDVQLQAEAAISDDDYAQVKKAFVDAINKYIEIANEITTDAWIVEVMKGLSQNPPNVTRLKDVALCDPESMSTLLHWSVYQLCTWCEEPADAYLSSEMNTRLFEACRDYNTTYADALRSCTPQLFTAGNSGDEHPESTCISHNRNRQKAKFSLSERISLQMRDRLHKLDVAIDDKDHSDRMYNFFDGCGVTYDFLIEFITIAWQGTRLVDGNVIRAQTLLDELSECIESHRDQHIQDIFEDGTFDQMDTNFEDLYKVRQQQYDDPNTARPADPRGRLQTAWLVSSTVDKKPKMAIFCIFYIIFMDLQDDKSTELALDQLIHDFGGTVESDRLISILETPEYAKNLNDHIQKLILRVAKRCLGTLLKQFQSDTNAYQTKRFVYSLLCTERNTSRLCYWYYAHGDHKKDIAIALSVFQVYEKYYDTLGRYFSANEAPMSYLFPVEHYAMAARLTQTISKECQPTNGEIAVLKGFTRKGLLPVINCRTFVHFPDFAQDNFIKSDVKLFVKQACTYFHEMSTRPEEWQTIPQAYLQDTDIDLYCGIVDAFLCTCHRRETPDYMQQLARFAFFATIKVKLVKTLVLRGSVTNPEVVTSGSLLSFKKQDSIEKAQMYVSFLSRNLGNDFIQNVHKLPPAYIHDTVQSKRKSAYLDNLFFSISSDPVNIGKQVLEWALQQDREACDAMELYCKLHSKYQFDDAALGQTTAAMQNCVTNIEMKIMLQFTNTYVPKQFKKVADVFHENMAYDKYETALLKDGIVKCHNAVLDAIDTQLKDSAVELLESNIGEWTQWLSRVCVEDIIGPYYIGRISQVYDELRSTGGSLSPLISAYGDRSSASRILNYTDACRCLPRFDYVSPGSCSMYFANEPKRRIRIKTRREHDRVRQETKKIHGILAETFLTQRASNELVLGYVHRSAHGTKIVQEARQRALLSMMAQKSNVYACSFKYLDDEDVQWCIGVRA